MIDWFIASSFLFASSLSCVRLLFFCPRPLLCSWYLGFVFFRSAYTHFFRSFSFPSYLPASSPLTSLLHSLPLSPIFILVQLDRHFAFNHLPFANTVCHFVVFVLQHTHAHSFTSHTQRLPNFVLFSFNECDKDALVRMSFVHRSFTCPTSHEPRLSSSDHHIPSPLHHSISLDFIHPHSHLTLTLYLFGFSISSVNYIFKVFFVFKFLLIAPRFVIFAVRWWNCAFEMHILNWLALNDVCLYCWISRENAVVASFLGLIQFGFGPDVVQRTGPAQFKFRFPISSIDFRIWCPLLKAFFIFISFSPLC